jgi:hypothetical protein
MAGDAPREAPLHQRGSSINHAEMILFDVASGLMTNARLVRDYGQLFTKSKTQNEMSLQRIGKFLTRNSIMVEAHSTSERVRGRLHNVPVIEDDVPTWPAKYALTDREAASSGQVSLEDKKRQVGSLVFSAKMLNQSPTPASSKKSRSAAGGCRKSDYILGIPGVILIIHDAIR